MTPMDPGTSVITSADIMGLDFLESLSTKAIWLVPDLYRLDGTAACLPD